MLRWLVFFILMLLTPPAWAEIGVKDVRLGSPQQGLTRFVLELEQNADYRLFVLANPPRAVIDLPSLQWPHDLTPAASGQGVVRGWRHGQFGSGTRVVLDLTGPVSVAGTQMLPARSGGGPRLVIDLAAGEPQAFAALIGQNWGGRAQEHLQVAAAVPSAATARITTLRPPPLPEQRRPQQEIPLVMIDPGHGGVDPGAIAVTGRYEKDITLAIARQLASRLESSGRYRVQMTRSRDIFIPLRDRVRISREAGADLFISLHADSIQDRNIRGSTVYTLSDTASDKEAAELAESENRADELAGLQAAAGDDMLADILTNMSFRASLNESRDFSRLLAKNLQSKGIFMTERGERSAGFAVLKAPDVPSVLIEMGYLTNSKDVGLLTKTEYQNKLVSVIEQSVDQYFQRHRPSGLVEALAIMEKRH